MLPLRFDSLRSASLVGLPRRTAPARRYARWGRSGCGGQEHAASALAFVTLHSRLVGRGYSPDHLRALRYVQR
jgi:hypothetical protein